MAIKFHKMKTILHHADLFGYLPPKGTKIQGRLGAIISIMIVLAFIGYSLARFITFITNPNVNYAQEYMDTNDNEFLTLPNFAMAFASDADYTDLSSKIVIDAVYNTSNNGTPNTVLQAKACDPSKIPSYLQKLQFICFTPSVVVPGTRQSQIKYQRTMMIMINVTDCAGFLSSLPASVYVMIPNQFDVDLRYRTFTNKTDSVFLERIRLQPPLLAYWGVDFQKQQFIITPDYLINWRRQDQTRVSVSKVRTSYGQNLACVDQITPIALMEFSLDSQIEKTFVNYVTSFMLFSEVGALWTTCILILGSLLMQFYSLRDSKKKKKIQQDTGALHKANIELPKNAEIVVSKKENSNQTDSEKAVMMGAKSLNSSMSHSIDLGKSGDAD